MDQRNAQTGAGQLQVGGGKEAAVIAIQGAWQSETSDPLFDDDLQADAVFMKKPSPGGDHSGKIVDGGDQKYFVFFLA